MCRSPYPDLFFLLKSLLNSPIHYQTPPPFLLNLSSYLRPVLSPLPISLNSSRLILYPHSKRLFSIVKFSAPLYRPPPPSYRPFNLKPFSLGVFFRDISGISGKVVINVFLILVCIVLILISTLFLSVPLNQYPPPFISILLI